MRSQDTAWRVPGWARAVRALTVVALAGYAVSVVPGVRGDGPAFSGWLDIGVGDGVQVLAGVLCLARAGWDRRHRLAWALLGLGPIAYSLGDLVYYAYEHAGAEAPYPSYADPGWLMLYPLVNAGLVLLVRAQLARVRTSLWLDGLVGGLGAAALLGAAVLRPVLSMTGGSTAVVLTNLAYPVGDLALLTVLILVFNLHAWRPGRSWWLLAAAPATLLVVDSVYLLQASSGTYVDGGLTDLGWPLAFVALGLAAWTRPPERRAAREGRASLAVPATLSVASTGVLFWGAVQTLPLVVCVLGLAAVLLASIRLLVALVETRRLVEARLEARTDDLSGLPNRRKFVEEMNCRLAVGAPRLTVMIVDLDRFKQVNDSLGHPVGDDLLRIVGARLKERLDATTTFVARLGGDEFAVLVDGDDLPLALRIGEEVRAAVSEPAVLSGLTLSIDASIGIAFAPAQGTTWDALMSRADAAMYVAKNSRTGVEAYVGKRDEGGIDRLALLAELRQALGSHELELHYQLVHRVSDGQVSSAEALIRWQHPTRGLLAPAEFLPIAIEAGLSRAVTDEVLRIATQQARVWADAGFDIAIAVNLTEADLADPLLVGRVATACDTAGLPTSLLRLELTETIASSVAHDAVVQLAALRERGHDLLLDDFGTGFSSLASLRDLPLDEVKLDRSFLRDLTLGSGTAMVGATIDLAHQVGLRLVAEGVETDDVLDMLRAMGCDSVQGYLLHRPASSAEVSRVLLDMVPDATPA